jgi:cytidylate kinase
MLERGQQADVDTVRQEIEARDVIDSSRDDSPLRAAEGAWRLDSSNMSISEVVAIILSQVNIADEG